MKTEIEHVEDEKFFHPFKLAVTLETEKEALALYNQLKESKGIDFGIYRTLQKELLIRGIIKK